MKYTHFFISDSGKIYRVGMDAKGSAFSNCPQKIELAIQSTWTSVRVISSHGEVFEECVLHLGHPYDEIGKNLPPTTAWTGGTKPKPISDTSRVELYHARCLFRHSMRAVKNYWKHSKGLESSVLKQARRQWKYARYNAHATYRQPIKNNSCNFLKIGRCISITK